MKKNPIGQAINAIFGWCVYFCLLAGGVAFFGFLLAMVIGGSSGEALAVWVGRQYFPVVIRITSFVIIFGLVGMYINREQALSMASDKQDADADIKMAQAMEGEVEKEIEKK